MSAMEDAANLSARGNEAYSELLGASAAVVEALQPIGAALQHVREVAENSTNIAAEICGEGHPGTGLVVAAAAQVAEIVENIMGQLSAIELTEVDIQRGAAQLSEAFDTAAAMLRGGGR